jgi:hypothetical protein
MNTYNKKMVTVALAAALMSSAAMANNSKALDTSWLSVSGEANLDYLANSSNDYETNLRAQDARITLAAQLGANIKAVLSAQLSETLRQNGVDVKGDQFDLDQFIHDAYVEIKLDAAGQPMAVIVGKQAIPFGQNASRMAMYKDNLLYGVTNIDQVVGLTVKLDKGLFAMLDGVEASVFENGVGDLKISKDKGLAIRVSKKLAEKFTATASGVIAEQAGSDVKDRRASLGVVMDNGDGSYKIYAEGVVRDGNLAADPKKANYAATVGGAMQVGPGEVVVEYSWLEKSMQQVALAYNLPLGENLTISPEVRRNIYDNATGKADDTTIGVRAKASFGASQKAKRN